MSEPQIYEQIVKKMSEKRLNEIKNSIDLQVTATKAYEYDETLITEEVELYDEVVRLREENNKLNQILHKIQVHGVEEENTTVLDLIKENERLKDIIEHKPFFDFTADIYDELEDYKSRIEKAVEYIENAQERDGDEESCSLHVPTLKSILEGKSDE